MQKAFDLIVERLEELHENYRNKYLFGKGNLQVLDGCQRGLEDAIKIVNQVEEEYEHKLSICNNSFYENMPQDFQDAVKVIMEYCQHEDCAYSCDDCSNCPNPLSVIRCGDATQSDGWIPCERELPKLYEPVLVCNKDGRVFIRCINWISNGKVKIPSWSQYSSGITAWQPLPQPYK